MNTSVILLGHADVARKPVSGSISAVTMSDGTGKLSAKYCAGSEREKSEKMGTAACEPGGLGPRLSSWPPTPTGGRRGGNPPNQASRPWFVVRVLPAGP